MSPPGLRCTAERGDAAQLRRGPRCSRAGELGRGQRRGPPPARTPTRRDPTPRRRSRDQRKGAAPGPMVQGLGVWPIAGFRQAGRCGQGAPLNRRAVFSDASPSSTLASGAASGRARRGSRPGFAAFGMGFGRAFESCPIMQAYRTSPPHDKRGGFLAKQRDKAPRRQFIMRQVIRADLDLARRPPRARSASAFPRRLGRRARTRRASTKAPEAPAFPPPAPIPAWARASGRAGEGEPLFAAGAGLALLDAASARRSARRRGAALTPRAAERRGLRQNPAPQRRRSRAARPPLRRRRPAGPAAQRSCRSGATAPAGRPASTPAGSADAAARLDLAVDPNGLAASLKACAGEGDPVSAAAKAAALAFSALPDAPPPKPRFWRFGRSTCVIAHPAALAAARAADRHENLGSRRLRSDGGRAAATAGRPRLARTPPQARSPSPPPPPSTSPPISARRSEHPDRRRAQTARQTGRRKSSTSCSPKIASRRPKPPATRR